MAWVNLVNSVDTAAISLLGGVPATFTPQNGSGAQTIEGIIRSPAMDEDYTPGGSPGTAVVRFFVRFANISPQPQKGDTITLNGVTYLIVAVPADTEGGAILNLRAM